MALFAPRPVALRAVLLCTLTLAALPGCSVESGATLTLPGPDDDCQPMTCEALGAECGSADDGCGNLLDCGGCDSGVCGIDGQSNTCVVSATSCQPLAPGDGPAQCGVVSDGCGGFADFGACEDYPGTLCSDDHQCITINCGGQEENACGSCGALPMEIGEACPCEGSAACSGHDMICDDGGVVLLDDTDDGVDELTTVSGFADLSIQDTEYDEYRVTVVDRRLSLLQPEFHIAHPGGYALNVCVIVDGLNGKVEASCGGNDAAVDFVDDGVRRGCCLTLESDQAGESGFELDFPVMAAFHDYSAQYRIEVRAIAPDDEPEDIDSCEPYRISYRF